MIAGVRSVNSAMPSPLMGSILKSSDKNGVATRLVQNGVDLYKVKELLGHKTIAMTMRYAHHCPESLRSSIEVLDNWYNSGTIENFGDEAGLKNVEKTFKIKHGSV